MIALGIIRKPHGVRGEASVEIWTDSAERFEEVRDVTLVSPDEARTRDVRIEEVRFHAGRALLKFSGIESPEEVMDFRGWTVEIPDEQARKLEQDEYFLHDLAGLKVVDRDGNDRGEVVEAAEGGSGVLLTVRKGNGRTYDLPFAADICVDIDLGAKRIIVEMPEGLDDLDAVED